MNHRPPPIPIDQSRAGALPRTAGVKGSTSRSSGAIPQNRTFRQKVESANPNAICSATKNVGRRTIQELLAKDLYAVPIFQRRYCWTRIQWSTLLVDIQRGGKHSMGRLTCTNTSTQPTTDTISVPTTSTTTIPPQQQRHHRHQRSIILDGQQRTTTITILLAAIRDRLWTLDPDGSLSMIDKIQDLLFPDKDGLNDWLEHYTKQESKLMYEGMELEFARLIPTFCDRLSYYTAILPLSYSTSSTTMMNVESHQPMRARRFFDKVLRQQYPDKESTSTNQDSISGLHRMLQTVWNGLDMLYFPIDLNPTLDDGTGNLTVVYERLALRDATFCKPHRDTEYASMQGCDMVRNLLLGSFDTNEETIEFYKDYWLPVERRTRIVSPTDGSGDCEIEYLPLPTLGQLLQDFLKSQLGGQVDTKHNSASAHGTGVGGQLLADFEAWMKQDAESLKVTNPQVHARSIATRILAFSNEKYKLPIGYG